MQEGIRQKCKRFIPLAASLNTDLEKTGASFFFSRSFVNKAKKETVEKKIRD